MRLGFLTLIPNPALCQQLVEATVIRRFIELEVLLTDSDDETILTDDKHSYDEPENLWPMSADAGEELESVHELNAFNSEMSISFNHFISDIAL